MDGALLEGEFAIGAMLSEVHAISSHGLNLTSTAPVHMVGGDIASASSHHVNMAASGHDWYLREWFETQGLKQNDLVTKLDYPKNTANRLWHSVQPYRRDFVEAVADLLNIAPFELLMPPADAMALRRLKSAIAEVSGAEVQPEVADIVKKRTGTDG